MVSHIRNDTECKVKNFQLYLLILFKSKADNCRKKVSFRWQYFNNWETHEKNWITQIVFKKAFIYCALASHTQACNKNKTFKISTYELFLTLYYYIWKSYIELSFENILLKKKIKIYTKRKMQY